MPYMPVRMCMRIFVDWRNTNLTRKTAGTAENPACKQTPFCDIQMVVILLLANISIPYRYPTTENLSDKILSNL